MGILMKNPMGIIPISVLMSLFLIAAPLSAAGTETRVSFSADPTCENLYPSGDTGWIVWEEQCSGVSNIIMYNYSTGVQTTVPKTHVNVRYPSIRGNKIVFIEDDVPGSAYVYYTDLNSLPLNPHKVPLAPSGKYNPAVYADKIVWQEMDPAAFTYDIMLYDISSTILYNLTPDTTASDQTFPSIYGDRVAWIDTRNGGQDIYFNDTSDWSLHQIPAVTPGVWYDKSRIYQDFIISYGDDNEIYLSDLSTNTQITSDGNQKLTPSLVPPLLAWKESADAGFTWDIVLYNTATSSKDVITTSTASVNPDPDTAPVIITPDSRIAWVDTRAGASNIYMYSNGISTTCPAVSYSTDITEGSAPLTVRFTDTSTNSPTRWLWDFGDGNTATSKDATHTYTSNGKFPVNLTVSTPYCRNRTLDSRVTSLSVGVPSVDFSVNSTEGISPMPVVFTATGTNSPTSWAWTFGYGGTAAIQNPVHTYTTPGTYPVTLVGTNAIGSGTKTKTAYITALNGTSDTASLPLPGISVSGTPQNLTFDKALVPSYSLSGDKKTLSAHPLASYGWQNITFLSGSPAGFSEDASTISGTFGTVIFQTTDITPTTFSSRVGNNLNPNFRMQQGSYDDPGTLKTQVWEGASPTDNPAFGDIARFSGYSSVSRDVAYTVSLTRSGISTPSSIRANVSASTDWVKGSSDIVSGRQSTYLVADGYNAQGDFVGIIFPSAFVGNDTIHHVEYFSVDLPSQYSYLTKFALAKLSGTGNPLQLITLTVASHASSPSSSESSGDNSGSGGSANAGSGKGAGVAAVQEYKAPPEPVPPDPGVTGKVYANADAVISQATSLMSTDKHATLVLSEGVVAKDVAGNALSSVTLAAISPDQVPSGTAGSSVTFAGMAYELGPDGATFSPSISLTFTVPQAQWGKEYIVRSYDQITGTWQDLPTTFDPTTGKVTAQIPHFCCIGLFTKSIVNEVATRTVPVTTMPPQRSPPQAAPPTTAVSIFTSMMLWVVNLIVANLLIVVVITLAVLGMVVYRKRRFNG
jgi:beta propeller repeat protein